MVAFKTNWLVLLSNEFPSIFCSWPNGREKQGNFWMDKHRLILSLNCLLLVGVMLTIKKCSSSGGNIEHPGNVNNKSLASPFNWASWYIIFSAKLKERERHVLGSGVSGATLLDYPQQDLVVIRDEKVSFCEIWYNFIPPLFFIRSLYK